MARFFYSLLVCFSLFNLTQCSRRGHSSSKKRVVIENGPSGMKGVVIGNGPSIIPRLKRNLRQSCQENEAYYFNMQPKSITVAEGGRAFLECNVSNRCSVQFRWSLDRKTVQNTTRRYQNGSNLVISRVNRTLDGGEFHCVTTLRGISRESSPAVLYILCKLWNPFPVIL